jgi:hypothetical protein
MRPVDGEEAEQVTAGEVDRLIVAPDQRPGEDL